MGNKKALAFICDENYVKITSVALTSFIQTKAEGVLYDIYIIYAGNNNGSIEKFKLMSTKGIEIHIIQPEPLDVSYDHLYVTTAALYKFRLHNLIENHEKILYCDSDIIFAQDISDIFDIDLNKKYAAVVKDAAGMILHYDHARLDKESYFNSGVMLLNAEKLRAENAFHKMLSLRSTLDNKYMDQDVFNIYFGDDVLYLDHRYNYMISNIKLDEKIIEHLFGATFEREQLKIIHYTGITGESIKSTMLYATWEKYHKLSPYANETISPVKLPQQQQKPAQQPAKQQPSFFSTLFKPFYHLGINLFVNNNKYVTEKITKEVQKHVDKAALNQNNQIDLKLNYMRKEIFHFLAFQNAPVRENSILIVEGAQCHGETIPAFANYFEQLGFSVDVLLTLKVFGFDPFCRMTSPNIHIYQADRYTMPNMLQLPKMRQYEYLMFNSRTLYYGNKSGNSPLYHEHFNPITPPKQKTIALEHHLEHIPSDTRDIVIIEETPKDSSLTRNVVYPFYFGDIQITGKNTDCTKFVAIGNFEPKRRDHDLLFGSIRDLVNAGHEDFEVTLIGRSTNKIDLPADIKNKIAIYYDASYEKIYSCMEAADYFLPLFNPSNKEHMRYLTFGTSGSVQLIYTFATPCIIHERFAKRFSFDNANSIVYADNADLSRSMQKAIALPQEVYQPMQTKLLKLRDEKCKSSLTNLRNILGI